MAQSEDSPVAMKLKKMWLKTPVGEEQAAQAVLDPAIGEFTVQSTFSLCHPVLATIATEVDTETRA